MTLSATREERAARARRALDGLSVGDAFGERFFVAPSMIRGMIEDRALPAPPWRWTDDTAMALGVVEVLERDGDIDPGELARVFARNWRNEPWRGYGRGAQEILEAVHAGEDWRTVSRSAFGGSGSMGNGGGMRTAPLGAWFADDLDALVAAASRSAAPTHAHAEGAAGAIAVALAAAYAARRRADPSAHPANGLLAFVEARTPDGLVRDGLRAAISLGPARSVLSAAATLGTGGRVLAHDTIHRALVRRAAPRRLRGSECGRPSPVSETVVAGACAVGGGVERRLSSSGE